MAQGRWDPRDKRARGTLAVGSRSPWRSHGPTRAFSVGVELRRGHLCAPALGPELSVAGSGVQPAGA